MCKELVYKAWKDLLINQESVNLGNEAEHFSDRF